jgi:serine-type D-Ala-D-Ala carboxypeptidase (penicillin-binding protein 5/6)
MASRRTSRVTALRTTTVMAGWRRATASAAGVLIAAALVGPAAASGPPSNQTPLGDGELAADVGSGGLAPDASVPYRTFPTVTAEAAIVVDRATGEVLGSKNPDLKWAPASTTKMMTGLVASEAIAAGDVSLSDTVTIPSDVDIELHPDAEGAGLAPGDTISLRDLLYITMLDSEGDAATAVAMHVGGYPSLSSLDARGVFIERMNERAAELGLDRTSFVDVSGRDPEDLGNEGVADYEKCTPGNHFRVDACAHYSTARDLAALARVLLDDPLLARIVRTPSWTTTTWRSSTSDDDPNYTANNSNQLLTGSSPYPGVYGVKTGTSNMARQNLVSAATNLVVPAPTDIESAPTARVESSTFPTPETAAWRTGVVAVVLGSDDTTLPGNRYTDSRAVLDFALHRTP